MVDWVQLGERTIYIDCDVLQADGGTRTASISGATEHKTFDNKQLNLLLEVADEGIDRIVRAQREVLGSV